MPIHGNLPRTCGDKPIPVPNMIIGEKSTPHMRG